MKKNDRTLQKVARLVGKICYLLAVVCAVFWYLKKQELGAIDAVTTSFLASSFFFVCVGFLLGIMGNADIPDLKVRSARNENQPDDEKA